MKFKFRFKLPNIKFKSNKLRIGAKSASFRKSVLNFKSVQGSRKFSNNGTTIFSVVSKENYRTLINRTILEAICNKAFASKRVSAGLSQKAFAPTKNNQLTKNSLSKQRSMYNPSMGM